MIFLITDVGKVDADDPIVELFSLSFRPFPNERTVADPGFSKWGGAVLSQMGGRTSCFQVKSA